MENNIDNLNELISNFTSGRNIFITGQAGVGKTYLLNQFLNWLDDNKYKVGLAGSTGIAATNIGGTTVHRMFGIKESKNYKDFLNMIKNDKNALSLHNFRMKELAEYDLIIIDEVSMVGSKLIDLMDKVLKKAFKNDLPFGGKQIVFSGDFLQLPPVEDDFSFENRVWKKLKFKIIHLTKVYRQEDDEFLNVLNKIRIGKADSEVSKFISEAISKSDFPLNTTKLFSRNITVDEENEKRFNELPGEEVLYKSVEKYENISFLEELKENIRAPETLKLKVGAKVMALKNADDLSYINGSIGVVKNLSSNSATIEFENGSIKTIESWTWTKKNKSGDIVATYSQLPIRLAYAITIHKSQGMTIDGNLIVDCNGIKSDGQLYVAISRVKDPNKLKILNFNDSYISANEKAMKFYSKIK